MSSPSFKEIYEPLMAIGEVCGDVVPRSEIYNETWMLRLTMTLLKSSRNIDVILEDGEKETEVIREICNAVQYGWISEGGLKPIFDGGMEKTTWTDAILGSVKLDKEKRSVEVCDKASQGGVIVVEAKMASKLSSGVTHSKSYNQIVRNIACLSRLVLESRHVLGPNLEETSRVVVLAPKSKIDKWKDKAGRLIKQWKEDADEMASKIKEIIIADKRYKSGLWKRPNDTEFPGNFNKIVQTISQKSCVISWESILSFIKCHSCMHDDFARLAEYYETTKKIYGIKSVKY